MSHVVLIGDSVFDNGAYTQGGPDVVSQVRTFLVDGWKATLLAVDGSTTGHVADQLRRLPTEATHLVLSVGGNDALMQRAILWAPMPSLARSMAALATVAAGFETNYRRAVDACLETGLPLVLCTIYNGCFEDPAFQRVATATLSIFNDAILRVAIEHSLTVIDLRAICARPEDYANPIE